MSINEIVFFTTNPAKIKEAELVFNPLGINVTSHYYDFIEIQSTSQEAILQSKVDQIKDSISQPFIVDDSGLYLKSYSNFPGVMTKFIYETISNEGVLRLLPCEFDRSAYFKALVCLSYQDRRFVVEGLSTGAISSSIRGEIKKGFLFESLFIPDGEELTLAEMALDHRQIHSYRIKALRKVAEYLLANYS